MRCGLALLLLLAGAPALADPPLAPGPEDTPVWLTYAHAGPAFSLAIPASHFYAQPAPPAGDGAIFTALDGLAEIRAWAAYNVLEQDLAALLGEALERHGGDEVTYRRQGAGWFVLSGYSGDAIFYEKALLDEAAVYHLAVRYPVAQRDLYDPLLGNLAASFRPGG
jgi:hypothetical protein